MGDTVFVMETTTEELMTIKPQARIANETNTIDLNQTSSTSTSSFSETSTTTPKISKRKHFRKRTTTSTTEEPKTRAKNNTTDNSQATRSQQMVIKFNQKPISDTKTTFTFFIHNPFKFMCGGFKSL